MKQTIAFGALWATSAASAVGLGFLAVSLVDAGAATVADPVSATASSSAAPSASEDVPPPASAPRPPVAAPVSGEHATVGGTVFASCDGEVLRVAAAPAAGWWLDDQDQHGEVEFESATRKAEVHVGCADGAPVFHDEGVRADDDRPEDSSGAGTTPAGTVSSTDDSAGRVGGGHGSDDPPGDDSAGRDD